MIYQSLIKDFDVCDDSELSEFLRRVVGELEEENSPYDCSITVVRSEDANAFALPGGRIIMLSGLLAECSTGDGVAGVLAHEVAHIEQRHGLKQLLRSLGVIYFTGMVVGAGFEELETAETITELGALLIVLQYSRQAETEADAIAILKLRRAQREISGLAKFFENVAAKQGMGKLERALGWLSSHPVTADRIRRFKQAETEEAAETVPWLTGENSWIDYQNACIGKRKPATD